MRTSVNVEDVYPSMRKTRMVTAIRQVRGESHAGARLKALRERAGYSMDEIARAMGYKGASSYQRYETPDVRGQDYLPMDFVFRVAKVLVNRGDPPIRQHEVLRLSQLGEEGEPVYASPPGRSGRYAPSGVVPKAMSICSDDGPISQSIREVDIRAVNRGGKLHKPEEGPLWYFPVEWLASEFGANASDLKVITIEGDGMVSDPPGRRDLEPGDKAVVNQADVTPASGKIFVIFDGVGLVPRRLHVVPKSDPVAVRVEANDPRSESYEIPLEDLAIWGRIVGRWQRF